MMRRPFVFAIAGGVAALAMLPAAANNQIRIALDTNPTHVRNRNSEAFAQRVRAEIPKFAPEVFPSAQLFRDRDMSRALRQSGVEMGVPVWWNLDGIARDAALSPLPMFYGLDSVTLTVRPMQRASWTKFNANERRTLVRTWEESVDKERAEAAEAQRAAPTTLMQNNVTIVTASQEAAAEAHRRLMATQDQVAGGISMDLDLVADGLWEIRAASVAV